MKIGIFSKMEMSGGSEFRCAEMANAIRKYTEHSATILCEKNIPDKILSRINGKVEVCKNVFLTKQINLDK